MRVLVSADWHIKLGQKNVPKDWQKDRYLMFFDKLGELENEVDIHLVAGDVFDTLPKPEEVALFLDFVSRCSIPTIIIDGNHCATTKGKTFLTVFKDAVKKINDKVHIVDGIEKHYNIDFIPYTNLKTFKPEDFSNNILCTHVRGEIKPHVVPEIDLEIFDRWKTVLAGDLHSYSNSQRNILYPGSPMTISFHRNETKNGVIIFNTVTHEHEWVDLGLPQLLRKTVDSEDDIVSTDYHHTVYELIGDISSLSKIDAAENSIIDKKIIKRESKASLALANMSIAEELVKFLEEVEGLPPETIVAIMEVFNDYT